MIFSIGEDCRGLLGNQGDDDDVDGIGDIGDKNLNFLETEEEKRGRGIIIQVIALRDSGGMVPENFLQVIVLGEGSSILNPYTLTTSCLSRSCTNGLLNPWQCWLSTQGLDVSNPTFQRCTDHL